MGERWQGWRKDTKKMERVWGGGGENRKTQKEGRKRGGNDKRRGKVTK